MTLKSPADEPAPIEVSGHMGPWADAAFRAYDALRAEIPLTTFRAEADAVTVTLAHEVALARARALDSTPYVVAVDQARPSDPEPGARTASSTRSTPGR